MTILADKRVSRDWVFVSVELDYDEVFSQNFMEGSTDFSVSQPGEMVFASLPDKGHLVLFSMTYGPSRESDYTGPILFNTTWGVGEVADILHLPEKYTEVRDVNRVSPEIKVFLKNLMFDDNCDEYEMLKRYRRTTTALPEAPETP